MCATVYRSWDSHGPNGHAPRAVNTPMDQIGQILCHHLVHLILLIVHLYGHGSFHFLSPVHASYLHAIVLGIYFADFGPLTDLNHCFPIFLLDGVML